MHLFNQKYSELVFYIIKIPKKEFSNVMYYCNGKAELSAVFTLSSF